MSLFRNIFLALCLGLVAAPAAAQDAPAPPGQQAADLVSEQEISEIRQAHYKAAIQPVLDRVKRTRRFSPDDEAEIQKLSDNLHVVPDFEPLIPYRKLWEIETTGEFEPEPIDVDIRLGRNELCYYVCPSIWAQIKTKQTRTG